MSGMSRLSLAIAAGAMSAAAFTSTSATAQVIPAEWGTIAGTAAIMSDYVFRGVSQTKEKPALQGALEYTKEVGPVTPYAGLFLSNVTFPDTTNTSANLDVNYELDITAGVRGTIGSFGWDLGYIKYYYPYATMPANASPQLDWTEWAVKLNYDFGFAKILGAYYYSKNYSIDAEKGHYYNGGVDVPLPWEVTFAGRIGRLKVQDNADLGLPDYTDWNLGVSKTFDFLWGGTVGLTYYDTNIKKGTTLRNSSNNTVAVLDQRVFETTEPRVVLSFTKAF
jgi:uncharacterized protein (TIGR02001 family)